MCVLNSTYTAAPKIMNVPTRLINQADQEGATRLGLISSFLFGLFDDFFCDVFASIVSIQYFTQLLIET